MHHCLALFGFDTEPCYVAQAGLIQGNPLVSGSFLSQYISGRGTCRHRGLSLVVQPLALWQ